MFDMLSDRLQNVFKRLRGAGKLTEKELDATLREVRLALLEADVNFKVVKEFVARIRERGLGAEVMQSLTPAQQVIKIVSEELTSLMGGAASKLSYAPQPPTIIFLVGLQGSGKTTATAKLGAWLRKNGKNPLLVAADTQRPAAVDQLQTLGKDWGVAVVHEHGASALENAKLGLEKARNDGYGVAVVDTAGRLHVDQELMDELREMRELHPHYVLLVVDAMTGQDAVNLATTFQEQVGIDGVILTKLDGDARGGAALSIAAVTGKPIRFASFGEKADSLDVFHPDRMSSRILGMGDVLTLIEKAQETADQEDMEEVQRRMLKAEITLDDFVSQMRQLRKMGPLTQLLKMLPGIPGAGDLGNLKIDENDVGRMEAIVLSMTPEERRNPAIINGSRRSRIAQGSGTSPGRVNQLVKSFNESKKMLKKLSGGKGMGKAAGMKGFPFGPQ